MIFLLHGIHTSQFVHLRTSFKMLKERLKMLKERFQPLVAKIYKNVQPKLQN